MPRKKGKIPETIADISEFVINPHTGNLVRINSKTYKQLMKDNILGKDPKTRENPIVLDGGATDDIKHKLRKEKDTILIKKDNKIYSQRRKLTNAEYLNNTMLKSAEVVKNHLHEFTDEMDDDTIYKKVKQLIGQKMIGEPSKKITDRIKKKTKFKVSEPIDAQEYEINENTEEETDNDAE